MPSASSEWLKIPMNQLQFSPENVRRTPASKAAQDELEANIAALGVLENLIVRKIADDAFEVVAGSRRLAALRALRSRGEIEDGYEVPCMVTDGDASEISLAENQVRADMHPADQIAAFSALAAKGATAEEIAVRFGISPHTVAQRLRLSQVAPELIDEYREGKISLDVLTAFAGTVDQERQRAAYEAAKAQPYGQVTPYDIKRFLRQDRVAAQDAVAKFVGREAYEAAGGKIELDLFAGEHEDGTFFEDPDLLRSLAQSKLDGIAAEFAKDWKWAEAHVEVHYDYSAGFGRIDRGTRGLTEEEETERAGLMEKIDGLENREADEWSDELQDEYNGLQDRVLNLNDLEEEPNPLTEEDRKLSGVIVTIAPNGEQHVYEGLVKPEDMPEDTGGGDAGEEAGGEPSRPPTRPATIKPDPGAAAREAAGYTMGAAEDARYVRTALIKAYLESNYEAAFDLLLFTMARSIFRDGYAAKALNVNSSATGDRPVNQLRPNGTVEFHNPGAAMLEDRSGIPLDWLVGGDDGNWDDAKAFAAMRALSPRAKQTLFSAAVARTVHPQLAFDPHARPELEATVARLNIPFGSHVFPSAGLLWGRMKKGDVIKIAKEVLGEDVDQAGAEAQEAGARRRDGGGVRGAPERRGPGGRRAGGACGRPGLDPARV